MWTFYLDLLMARNIKGIVLQSYILFFELIKTQRIHTLNILFMHMCCGIQKSPPHLCAMSNCAMLTRTYLTQECKGEGLCSWNRLLSLAPSPQSSQGHVPLALQARPVTTLSIPFISTHLPLIMTIAICDNF